MRIYLLFLLITLVSCVTESKVQKYLERHPEKVPVNETVTYLPGLPVVDTQWIASDTLIYFDTIWQNQYGYRIDTVIKPCPPSKIVRTYMTDTIVKTVENTTWRVAADKYYNEWQTAANIADYHRKNAAKWLWLFIGVLIAAGCGAVLLFTKK